jgi:BASS family bile acid:Na+ symporter
VNASAAIFVAIASSLALTIFVVGLRATHEELAYLPRHPALWLRSALVMSVLVPLLALWTCSALGLRPSVAVGLFILALSPVPLVLPARRMWGERNDAYPVSLVTFASVLGAVIAPLTIPLLLGRLALPPSMSPAALARILWIGLLIPWLAGILLRPLATRLAPRAAELLSLLSAALLAGGMIPLAVRLWPTLRAIVDNGTVSAVVLLSIAAVLIGRLLGGPVADDRRLLACAATSRHPGMAIIIAWTLVPNDKVVMAVIVLATIVGALASLLQALVRPRRALLDHRTMHSPPVNVVG